MRRSFAFLVYCTVANNIAGQAADAERVILSDVLSAPIGRPDSVFLTSELRLGQRERQTFEQWSQQLWPAGWRHPVSEKLLRRFWDANQHPRLMASLRLPLAPQFRLMSSHAVLPPDASTVTVSAVGFSEGHDSALVAVQFRCPRLCGSDEVILYVRQDGAWRRARTVASVDY